jgi:plastocyanin
LATLLVAASMLGRWQAAANGTSRVHTVTMEGMKFVPSTVWIRPGDHIVFKNNDLVPHTATAKQEGGFDSGVVKPGESWTFTPQRTGRFNYVCLFHPMMEGKIEELKP